MLGGLGARRMFGSSRGLGGLLSGFGAWFGGWLGGGLGRKGGRRAWRNGLFGVGGCGF